MAKIPAAGPSQESHSICDVVCFTKDQHVPLFDSIQFQEVILLAQGMPSLHIGGA